MGLGIFIFYFCIFIIFFLSSRKKGEKLNYKTILIIPAILALLIFMLSVVKIFFIYKILMVIIFGILFLITYWHWGESIRRWFS
jgi:amino acid permease